MGCSCGKGAFATSPDSISNRSVGSAVKNYSTFFSNRTKIQLSHNVKECDMILYKDQNIFAILHDPTCEKFCDPFFVPDITSLIPPDKTDISFEKTPRNYIEEYKDYQWLRFDEIYGHANYQLFQGKLDPQDINQGSLGSCYLLCSLSGMCEYEERIKNMFVTQDINTKGAYSVKFLIQGMYHIVTVDDFIPCKKDYPAFCTSKQNEVWAIIAEKCWAKLNSSCYMKIWMGTPIEALTCLSEAPCIYEYHRNFIVKHKESVLWEKIINGLQRKWVVCTNTEEILNFEDKGLVPFHAYSIIKAYNIQKLRLLKIRNPWGDKEWKGDYSAKSSKWTEELKKEIASSDKNVRDKDGTFFMSFEDFVKYFPWTFFSKYEENFSYRYSKFSLNPRKSNHEITGLTINPTEYAACFLEISASTKCYICLHQQQKRFINPKTLSGYQYKCPLAVMILSKLVLNKNSAIDTISTVGDKRNYSYTHVKSEFINLEKLYIEIDLTPGEYHLFAKSIWEYDTPYDLVISTYAQLPVEIFKLPYQDIPESFMSQILTSIALKTKRKKKIHKEETTSFCSNTIFESNNLTGYGIFYYENNSDQGVLHAKIFFNKLEGIRVLSECQKTNRNEYDICIPPHSSGCLFLEMVSPPWQCGISWSHSLSFEYPMEIIIQKYLKSSKTERYEIKGERGLDVYKIPYDGGYVIMTDNRTDSKYLGCFDFKKLKNYEIENEILDLEHGVEITVDARTRHYMKIKCIDKSQGTLSSSSSSSSSFNFIRKFSKII